MQQDSQQNPKPTVKDFLQIVISVGQIYHFWPQLKSSYNYFFQDNSPVDVASDALGEASLATVISTSQTNDLRFKSEYVGKQFAADGKFKEANKDLGNYHIAVDVESREVACETTDASTLATVSGLSSGDNVRIYGVVDDTWMGALQLRRCGITH